MWWVVFLLVLAVLYAKLQGIAFHKAIKYMIIWVAVGMVFLFIHSYKYEIQKVLDRLYANLIPGYAINDGYVESIVMTQNGHYVVNAVVNDLLDVNFLVDTGATFVSLTRKDALQLGVDLSTLAYDTKVYTANGVKLVAPIILKSLAIGNIRVTDIKAYVSKHEDTGAEALLGMNFLSRLDSYTVRGNLLILKGKR